MMNKSKLSTEELLYRCSMRINNSMNDELILSAVTQYGYDTDKLQQGKNLLEEAQQASENYTKEYHDVDIAFDERNKLQTQVNGVYNKHVTIAKIALKNDHAALVSLDLNGRRATRISKWLVQTSSFYTNILNKPEWIEKMSAYGITKESLEEGLTGINNIKMHNELILREKGDAQQATLLRDSKIEDLYEWIQDYETIASLALMDKPQLLEKLGMIIKN